MKDIGIFHGLIYVAEVSNKEPADADSVCELCNYIFYASAKEKVLTDVGKLYYCTLTGKVVRSCTSFMMKDLSLYMVRMILKVGR